jgi:hypothetical protein
MNATTVEVLTNHVAMISHPGEVSNLSRMTSGPLADEDPE